MSQQADLARVLGPGPRAPGPSLPFNASRSFWICVLICFFLAFSFIVFFAVSFIVLVAVSFTVFWGQRPWAQLAIECHPLIGDLHSHLFFLVAFSFIVLLAFSFIVLFAVSFIVLVCVSFIVLRLIPLVLSPGPRALDPVGH